LRRFFSSVKFPPTIILIIIPFFTFLVSVYAPFTIVFVVALLIAIALPIGYMLHSTILPTEKYFKLKGFENAIIEFEYVKKILIVAAFLLVIIEVNIVIMNAYYSARGFDTDLAKSITFRFELEGIVAITLFIVLTTFLKIIFQIAKKEFRFYSAKAYFIIALKLDDDYKKVRYFKNGLDSYNKYLRRRLKFDIKDIKKVYSKFLYADTTEKQEITNSVCESLEDRDRLKVARYLSTLSKIPETELFVSESILQKLKTIGAFLAVAIPIVLSIITLTRH
jgi:hypothetical protein